MATVVVPTTVGFNVTGLSQPWKALDFQRMAQMIGAHSIAYLDDTECSLRIVCSPHGLDSAVRHLIAMIKAAHLFTNEQTVSLVYLERSLVLVLFRDGLPCNTTLVTEADTAIGKIGYGERSVILAHNEDYPGEDWTDQVHNVWGRLRSAGAVPIGQVLGSPYTTSPWQPASDNRGRIVVVDKGMVIIEAARDLDEIKDWPFCPALEQAVEVIGSKHFAIAVSPSWPLSEPIADMTHGNIKRLLQINQVLGGLTGGGFIDAEPPITFANF